MDFRTRSLFTVETNMLRQADEMDEEEAGQSVSMVQRFCAKKMPCPPLSLELQWNPEREREMERERLTPMEHRRPAACLPRYLRTPACIHRLSPATLRLAALPLHRPPPQKLGLAFGLQIRQIRETHRVILQWPPFAVDAEMQLE